MLAPGLSSDPLNRLKSWTPTNRLAASLITPTSRLDDIRQVRRLWRGERTAARRMVYTYLRLFAIRRGSKPSWTSYASLTAMSSGRWWFKAPTNWSGPYGAEVSNATTWPLAWTPASVLPAPLTLTHSLVSFATAFSSSS